MEVVGQASLLDFQRIVGKAHARDARPRDAIDGVHPRFVVAPGTTEAASEIMRLANDAGLAVAPRGAGTKLGWGNPPSHVDLVIETRRLNRVLEHEAGDMVVITQAGITLEALQEAVAGAGQMLGLDPLQEGATVGGIIAANAAGPRRLRYGAMKDLLIGLTIVLPDGTVAKSGGKVVKNVAGYDLGKLFTGSLGSLGLIVETIFRLHALPPERRVVTIELNATDAFGPALQALLQSALIPTVLDFQWEHGNGRLIVFFEGIEPSVVAQSERAVELAAPFGTARTVDEAEAATLWKQIHQPPWRGGETGLKINTVPAQLGRLLGDVEEVAHRHGLDTRVSGHAAMTIPLVALRGADEAVAAATAELRSRVAQGGGALVVLQAPPEVKEAVDVWGPAGDTMPIMRRIKEQFDPTGMMNPGRFVGGL
jgi:glycolate oxidase FAD binding subunit